MALSRHKNGFLNRRQILILVATIALTSLTFLYQQKAGMLEIVILFLAFFAALNAFEMRFKPVVLGHLGFALLICGITISSVFSITKEVNLKTGESFQIGSYNFVFSEIEHYAGKNFIARQGNFSLQKDNREIAILKPQMRYYPVADQATNEASIAHKISGDLYVVIGTKDEKENYALRAYFKPFIYFVWLGAFMIFASAILQVFRSLKKYAPKPESA